MKIEFKELSKAEFAFSIDNEDMGTVEKSIDRFGKDSWTAIDNLNGLTYESETMSKAVENLYYRILANEPDEKGNAHTCKSNPNDVCIKCMYM